MTTENFKKAESIVVDFIEECRELTSVDEYSQLTLKNTIILIRFLDMKVGIFWDSYYHQITDEEIISLMDELQSITKDIQLQKQYTKQGV